jgi:hypothetical protein
VTEADLEAVQRRRMFPTRVTQRLQLTMQNRIIAPLLRATEDPKPSPILRIMAAVPFLRQIPGRLIGLGVRPEHVEIPEVRPELAVAS